MNLVGVATVFLLVLTSAPSGRAATEPAAPAPRAKGFDGFGLTKNRNIFDPERRAMRVESADAPPASAAPSRPDHIALTGTMVTPGKALAFFSGSRSDYNRVIAISEKLGDCTLVAIGGNQVELERKGKPITLEVGKQLTLDDAGTITVATSLDSSRSDDSRRSDDYRRDDSRRSDDSRSGSSSSAGSSTSSPSAPPSSTGAPAAPTGDKSELLRRMMERRQKEMSK